MNAVRLARVCAVVCAALAAALPFAATSSTATGQSAVVPSFAHVVVIVMENKSASSIIGNTSQAPYVNRLAGQYAYSTNDFAVAHPSLPNYLALTGASTFGITSDCSPAVCPVNATNLMDRVEGAGMSWKAYMESMPATCRTTDAYPYAVKHNPFVYYNDIRNNASRCQSHVVPFTQLGTDLQRTTTTPAFSWITPNMCNDSHDCSIATGDAWLGQQIPAILSSPAFTTQNSLLVLTWDEDDSSGNNRVDLVVAGSQVSRARVSNVAYNHYSILSTLERAWNLSALTSNDSNAAPITDLFSSSSTSCTTAAMGASPSASQLAGTSVVFTGSTSGCPNPRYRFWIQPPAGSWQIVQDYGALSTYTWNTAGAAAGTYRYSVWVRDASSSAAYDAYFPGVAYSLTSNRCTSATASTTPVSPQASGMAVTMNGAAAGCPNPRYEFWVVAPGSTAWTVAQGYSTSTTFSWNTSGKPAGTYRYSVWARDSSSAASYDAYFPGTAYTLTTTPCTSATASAAPASPQARGTGITFTATATGCPNARYQFWILAPGSSAWRVVQPYSINSRFSWNTTGLGGGTYRYSVWVRDASSLAGYDTYFPGTAYTLS